MYGKNEVNAKHFSFIKKPTFLERGHDLAGPCPKGLCAKKIAGAAKIGLKANSFRGG